jgi:hypothetical protein
MKQKTVFLCVLALLVTLCLAAGSDDAQTKPMPTKEKAQVSPRSSPSSDDANPSPGTSMPAKEQVSAPPSQSTEAVSPSAVVPLAPKEPVPPLQEPGAGNLDHRGRDRNDYRHGDWGHQRRGAPRSGWHWGHPHNFWDFRPFPILVPYPAPVPFPLSLFRRDHGVCIVYADNDIVGSNFAYSLKEEIRSTPDLTLVSSPDEAKLELYVVSADQNEYHPGTSSAVSISYVWLPGNRFLTSHMLFVGATEVDGAAESIADYAHQLLHQYR